MISHELLMKNLEVCLDDIQLLEKLIIFQDAFSIQIYLPAIKLIYILFDVSESQYTNADEYQSKQQQDTHCRKDLCQGGILNEQIGKSTHCPGGGQDLHYFTVDGWGDLQRIPGTT